jgi:hypothetical protein
MRFIELTTRGGGSILVNVHQIISITWHEGDVTELVMGDGITTVKETPDEIMIKIRG